MCLYFFSISTEYYILIHIKEYHEAFAAFWEFMAHGSAAERGSPFLTLKVVNSRSLSL